MSLPPATADLYRANQRRQVATLAAVRAQWARMGADLEGSWATVGASLAGLVALSMVGAARAGAQAVPAALEQTGFTVPAEATVVPEAFGATASDGRPLTSLLYGAVVQARTTPGDLPARLNAGLGWLDLTVRTQISDATRAAGSVAITVRRDVGWVRMVNPPCCKDCAVQAGKWFRWNQGFLRHPHCDCVHRPAHADEAPAGYTDQIDPAQIHDLTGGERRALSDGADLGRVVNASRSGGRMSLAGGPRGRLTPDDIYARTESRSQALELLARAGYVT